MADTNEKVVKGEGTISNRGFSLVELIIVIAIMAILVGVLTPQYLSYMHKARVAADWANLKNYYTEITLDYISTGQYNPNVPLVTAGASWEQREIHFLNGQTAKMQAGYFAVTPESTEKGYHIAYYCNECRTAEGYEKHKDSCVLVLN